MKISIKKPSEALQAMLNGLDDPGNLQVSMDTFYGYLRREPAGGGICFGCAATCTLQYLADKKLPACSDLKEDSYRAKFFGLRLKHFTEFEYAIDQARLGYLEPLFSFCECGNKWREDHDGLFALRLHTWREDIPKVKRFIKTLQEEEL